MHIPRKTFEFDRGRRSIQYLKTTSDTPMVRHREIAEILKRANIKKGQTAIDYTSGTGVLLPSLVRKVGKNGRVYGIEPSKILLRTLRKQYKANKHVHLLSYLISLGGQHDIADWVVSLATLHHVAKRKLLFKRLAKILKPGGKIVIGDVMRGSKVAKYFDELIDQSSSTGHEHLFFDRASLVRLCRQNGLMLRTWRVVPVSWEFRNDNEAQQFMIAIHDIVDKSHQFYHISKDT